MSMTVSYVITYIWVSCTSTIHFSDQLFISLYSFIIVCCVLDAGLAPGDTKMKGKGPILLKFSLIWRQRRKQVITPRTCAIRQVRAGTESTVKTPKPDWSKSRKEEKERDWRQGHPREEQEFHIRYSTASMGLLSEWACSQHTGYKCGGCCLTASSVEISPSTLILPHRTWLYQWKDC